MMLAFVIPLLAGVAYSATGVADYLQCAKHQAIVDECSEKHLNYIPDSRKSDFLKSVSEIDDPSYLLKEDRLSTICDNNEGHLKEYFDCVFTNLTVCLENDNKTEINLPFPERISDGISTLCMHKDHINTSCILDQEGDAVKCYQEGTATVETQCMHYDRLEECSEEKMSTCGGGEYVVAYVKDGRPQLCGASAGERITAYLSIMLIGVVTSLFVSWM